MDRNSKEFKKLQAKWYKKLAKTGYDDIEQLDGNLKHWASQYYKLRHNAVTFKAKEEYYRLASQFLHDHKFESPLEEKIWRLHSEGMSISNITKRLKSDRVKIYESKVKKLRRNLESLMVIKFTGTEHKKDE